MLLTTRTVTKTAMIRSKKRYCFINGLWMYAISPRGWNGNHQKMHIGIRLVHKLMPDLRWDLQALSLFHQDFLPLGYHRPFPFENIEELPCKIVIMDYFRSAGGNTLLNDAHILAFEQMPAITNFAPNIVFSVFHGDQHTYPFPSTPRTQDSLFRSACKTNRNH